MSTPPPTRCPQPHVSVHPPMGSPTAWRPRLGWLWASRGHLGNPTLVATLVALLLATHAAAEEPPGQTPTLSVKRCDDFMVNGQGNAQAWSTTEWVNLNRRPQGKLDYLARLKMLYSNTGVYVLFDGSDEILTATLATDFADLWNEDVYECFFWTDENHPVYFEYEISPLGYELPILVPNLNGRFLGWRPWHYEGNRKTRKQTTAGEAEIASLAKVDGWRAEVFIPYALLEPLGNVPPKSGTRWRANFYRVDYDHQKTTAWDWARVGPSFHDFKNFGTLEFE